MPYQPKYLVLHDYGKTPVGWKPGTPLGHNPYHALVHGGRVQYRDPANPYGAPAPHAYKLNPQSIGLSWAGPVGGTPNAADLDALRAEIARIKSQFPGIQLMSHGEAYARRGSLPQASKLGRGMEEASWRAALGLDGSFRPAGAPSGAVPQPNGGSAGPSPQAMANALTGGQKQDPVIAALLKRWEYGAP